MSDKQQVIDDLSSIQTTLENALLELWEVTGRAQALGGSIEQIATSRLRNHVITYLEDMIEAPDLPFSIEAVKVELEGAEGDERA